MKTKSNYHIIARAVSLAVLFLFYSNAECYDSSERHIIENGFVGVMGGGAIYKLNNDEISDLIKDEYGIDGEIMLGALNTLFGARTGFQLSKTTGINEYDNTNFDGRRRSQNANIGLLIGYIYYTPYLYLKPNIGVDWDLYVVDQKLVENGKKYSRTLTEYPYGLVMYIPFNVKTTDNYINSKCIGISIKTTNYGKGFTKSSLRVILSYSHVGWSISK